MARPLRVEYEGAYYHVFSRGNKKQPVFNTDRDRRTFLKTLARMSERFDVSLFAYVLMKNHYHLLLRTNRANLSRAMHWLGTTYTTIFNIANSQVGHLFQGRFKSIIVENEAYLLQLSYYIHRNPVRAGIARRLIDYPWSSYPIYAYNRQSPTWLNTSLILSQFKSSDDVHKAYREKVQNYAEEENSIVEDIKHGVICGSQVFVDRIKDEYLKGKDLKDVPEQRKIVNDISAGDVIKAAFQIIDADIAIWKKKRRITKSDLVNRDMLVYYMWQTGSFSNSEIGMQLGLSASSISRRVGIYLEMLERDNKIRQDYDNFRSIIKV